MPISCIGWAVELTNDVITAIERLVVSNTDWNFVKFLKVKKIHNNCRNGYLETVYKVNTSPLYQGFIAMFVSNYTNN